MSTYIKSSINNSHYKIETANIIPSCNLNAKWRTRGIELNRGPGPPESDSHKVRFGKGCPMPQWFLQYGLGLLLWAVKRSVAEINVTPMANHEGCVAP